MNEYELTMIILATSPLVLAGWSQLANSFYELVQVGRGYVKMGMMLPNRRGTFRWVKPSKDKKVVADNMAYDFNDTPDYMITFSSFLNSVPYIFVDSKSHRQIKMFNTVEGEQKVNPIALDGVNKLAHKTGYLEGLGAAMNTKIWFLIAYLLIGAGIVVQFIPQLKQAAGG